MKIYIDRLMESLNEITLAQKKGVVLKEILSGRNRDMVIPNEQLPNGARMYYRSNLDFSRINELAVKTEEDCEELIKLILALINKINSLEKEIQNRQITDEQELNIDEYMAATAKSIQDEYSSKTTDIIDNQYGDLKQHKYSSYTHEKVSLAATAAESAGNVVIGAVKVPTGLATGTVDFVTDKVTFGHHGTNLKGKTEKEFEELANETYRAYLRKHGAVNMDDYRDIQEFTGAFLWAPVYAEAIGLDVAISDVNIEFATEKLITVLEHANKLGNIVDDSDTLDVCGTAADYLKIDLTTKGNPPIIVPRV